MFLAAPADSDWHALAGALVLPDDLRDDDDALAEALADRFASRPADAWERELTALDVACVAVSTDPLDGILFSDLGASLGVVVETHPRRRSATTRGRRPWSRSRDRVAWPVRHRCAAQHTDAVLAELGYSADRIDALRAAGVLGSVP